MTKGLLSLRKTWEGEEGIDATREVVALVQQVAEVPEFQSAVRLSASEDCTPAAVFRRSARPVPTPRKTWALDLKLPSL